MTARFCDVRLLLGGCSRPKADDLSDHGCVASTNVDDVDPFRAERVAANEEALEELA